MTPEGYDKVIPLIKPAAERLAKQGARAIALMGTSFTFYKGAAFNQQLTDTIRSATGLPANTMSTAVLDGLKTVGAAGEADPHAGRFQHASRLARGCAIAGAEREGDWLRDASREELNARG